MTQTLVGASQPKYQSRNPVARYLVQNFLRNFRQLALMQPHREVIELGCGEGELSVRLAEWGFRVRGFDISASEIEHARLRAQAAGFEIPFAAAAIEDLAGRVQSPFVVCCEVLEHVEDPTIALSALERIATDWLLVSVPREPLWRILNLCRGAYVGSLGNTPGHLHHFSSRRFRAFLATRFQVVELRQPLPWTMALCRRR